LVVNVENDVPISCFFIGIRKSKENKFTKRRGYLNNTGYEKYDDLILEYNSLLGCKEDIQKNLNFALLSFPELEEFRLFHTVNIAFNDSKDFIQRVTSTPSYWVDLTAISNSCKDYLSHLSKNTRTQIKRSIKEYESCQGAIKLEFAKDIEQAKVFFSNLEELHQKEWIKRGKAGAFSEPFFRIFHSRLIEKRFSHNEIQLVRIFTDKEDLGYLYNFVFNNEVLFYQSGFNYKENNKLRPGIVSHYLTILKCIESHYHKYNFLVGRTRYKQSLSTNNDTLNSIILSRNTLKSKLELTLRKIKLRFF